MSVRPDVRRSHPSIIYVQMIRVPRSKPRVGVRQAFEFEVSRLNTSRPFFVLHQKPDAPLTSRAWAWRLLRDCHSPSRAALGSLLRAEMAASHSRNARLARSRAIER